MTGNNHLLTDEGERMNAGQMNAILREQREAESEDARENRAALRNVARCVLDLTTITRHHNGRGRAATYNGDISAIAGAARQLAEMVLANTTPVADSELAAADAILRKAAMLDDDIMAAWAVTLAYITQLRQRVAIDG